MLKKTANKLELTKYKIENKIARIMLKIVTMYHREKNNLKDPKKLKIMLKIRLMLKKTANKLELTKYKIENKIARMRANPRMFRLSFKVYEAVFALKKMTSFWKTKLQKF